jgi:hypothetical protein
MDISGKKSHAEAHRTRSEGASGCLIIVSA